MCCFSVLGWKLPSYKSTLNYRVIITALWLCYGSQWQIQMSSSVFIMFFGLKTVNIIIIIIIKKSSHISPLLGFHCFNFILRLRSMTELKLLECVSAGFSHDYLICIKKDRLQNALCAWFFFLKWGFPGAAITFLILISPNAFLYILAVFLSYLLLKLKTTS